MVLEDAIKLVSAFSIAILTLQKYMNKNECRTHEKWNKSKNTEKFGMNFEQFLDFFNAFLFINLVKFREKYSQLNLIQMLD